MGGIGDESYSNTGFSIDDNISGDQGHFVQVSKPDASAEMGKIAKPV
jgi:hypothetical protein